MSDARWVVYDWAGNVVNLGGVTFDTFEDAWGHMYELFPDEDDFSDYEVRAISG